MKSAYKARDGMANRGIRFRHLGLLLAAAVLVAVGAPARARADVVYTFAASGTCANACGAYATITPGNGILTVKLQSTNANPISASDVLSGIKIVSSASVISTNTSLASQSGALIDIGKNSTTSVAGNPTHWAASASGSNIFLATAGAPASGTPIDMIIGPPGSGGYTNANGSITGNHNPFISGAATFVLNDPLMTSNAEVDAVYFQFGTGPDYTLTGVNTPEPASLALMATAVAGLAVPLARRRRSVRV